MKKTLLKMMLGIWCLVLGDLCLAVERLADLTTIRFADSGTAWLDVRNAKTYELEDTIRVSHSASNWVNQVATTEDEATVAWTFDSCEAGVENTVYTNCTDDALLTVAFRALGEYRFSHESADGKKVAASITVVSRQLGTKAQPWTVGATTDDSVVAWTNGTGTLVVEGVGAVGWAPWTESAAGITKLEKGGNVTGLDGIMATLPALTVINGLTLDELAYVGMVGAVKAGFSAIAVEG